MTTQEISLEQLINETPEAVYYAWTNEMALTQWLCQDARVAVQPHGRLYLYWPQGYHATGEYQQVEANKSLAFSWRGKDEAHSSRVAMTLTQVEGGTRVHLLHSHIAEESAASTIQQVWEVGLANLQAVLETGLDNRLYNRPFMGIMLQGQLTAEQLAARGVPANGAVELGGALPGTSAAEAGLQAQDLLIQIGDKAIETMPDIGQALQGKQIGDSLPLTVYRNGQPTTSTLTLRRRPAPHVPPTAEAFSAELGRAYAAADAQLDEILAGASDAVAWQSPAPGEWSAAEVLAHLIICERMIQTTVGVQLNGNPLPNWPDNDPPMIQAVLAVYPTLAELVAAWKTAEAETVALIGRLPEAFVGRKATYTILAGFILGEMVNHTQGHLRQIQEAVSQKL
ncbi:MAG: SRPBCC domain-containing protein [Chloroflexi bacterium]|nr:SRPBCC domain-containing protein [Chloroflexota bacterium]